MTGWRLKAGGGYAHQLYDTDSLDCLDEKEIKWKQYLLGKNTEKKYGFVRFFLLLGSNKI